MEQSFPPEGVVGEAELIRVLAERGAEAQTFLRKWCEAEESRVETEGPAERVSLDITKAKIYRAAGYAADAWDSLEAARTSAFNLGLTDLHDEAMAMMDDMDEKGK